MCRTNQVLSCTVTARTGAVHIASSAADSAVEDHHATANFGFCSSEPKQAPSVIKADNALWSVVMIVVREPIHATSHTIGCIDTAGHHLTG